MGKVTENDIAAFVAEFVNKVEEIDNDILYVEDPFPYSMRWGKKKITLYDAVDWDAGGVISLSYPVEEDVREARDDDKCVAYMSCDGELYEAMYNYEAYGAGGKKAEKLYHALINTAEKYGMITLWSGGGVLFYDEEYLNDDEDR